MMYLTTILLCIGIVLITIGIHTDNFILPVIGGFLIGVYNAIIYYRIDNYGNN